MSAVDEVVPPAWTAAVAESWELEATATVLAHSLSGLPATATIGDVRSLCRRLGLPTEVEVTRLALWRVREGRQRSIHASDFRGMMAKQAPSKFLSCSICHYRFSRKDLPQKWQAIAADYFTLSDSGFGRHTESNHRSALQVDHIFPSSRGGTARGANLQPLCSACNRAKLDRASPAALAYVCATTNASQETAAVAAMWMQGHPTDCLHFNCALHVPGADADGGPVMPWQLSVSCLQG